MPTRSLPPYGSRQRPPLAAATAVLATLAVLSLLASACGGNAVNGNSGKTSVIAAFYPWAWLAERIGGNAVRVTNLTEAGADPHSLELTPRQTVDIKRSELVVYTKGIQPAVDDAVAQHARDHAIDAASLVRTLPVPKNGETGGTSGHGHEGEPGAFDPHIWLDPVRFTTIAQAVGNRLTAVDPMHAQGYKRRTKQLVGELRQLDKEYRTGLRTCSSRTLVTSHAAFGYLADRYRLEQVGIAGLDPEVPPSPGRLAKVARLVKEKNVDVIFLERLAAPKVAKTVAREVGTATATLDPVAGLTRETRDENYLSLMRANLASLSRGLGCR